MRIIINHTLCRRIMRCLGCLIACAMVFLGYIRNACAWPSEYASHETERVSYRLDRRYACRDIDYVPCLVKFSDIPGNTKGSGWADGCYNSNSGQISTYTHPSDNSIHGMCVPKLGGVILRHVDAVTGTLSLCESKVLYCDHLLRNTVTNSGTGLAYQTGWAYSHLPFGYFDSYSSSSENAYFNPGPINVTGSGIVCELKWVGCADGYSAVDHASAHGASGCCPNPMTVGTSIAETHIYTEARYNNSYCYIEGTNFSDKAGSFTIDSLCEVTDTFYNDYSPDADPFASTYFYKD